MASNFKSFRNMNGIKFGQICGEAADVSRESVEEWKQRIAKETEWYESKDIANADETALFFRALTNKTLALKNKKCVGGKHSKERITLFLCAFVDGNFEEPLVVDKSFKPRCFRYLGLKNLPVEWHANKNVWMTSSIMKSWLNNFNFKMTKQKRKVILFLDNSACHPHFKLSNVKIVFIPPNTTNVLQLAANGSGNNAEF